MKKTALASLILILAGIIIGLYLREHLPAKPAAAKLLTISSRNLDYPVATTAKTVGEVLAEQNFDITRSVVLPGGDAPALNGITIKVLKPLRVALVDGGKDMTLETRAATVADLLYEQKIGLAVTDRISPDLSAYVGEGMRITIDRIVDVEVTETHDIPYEIKRTDDPESFYGRETVAAPGKAGSKEQDFLITYKNGVEIKRKLLRQRVQEKPQTEVRRFGTKMEVEDRQEGRSSWYAYQKCMCAAHPFFPKGRYILVTSLVTGKSIIVQINDRGPDATFHPDRIIDLDAVAFKQLAPLGAGTIGVRIELLRNE